MNITEFGAGTRIGLGPQAVVVILVLALAVAMAVEPTRQLLEQKSRIDGMSSDLRRIKHSNERLENRIARLQDPSYLEQEAREQSGLVKPGEISVVVMPPARARRDDASRPVKDRTTTPEPSFLESMMAFLGL
ncbi:MAG: septum formation initiator family protein [Actinomycetota bacterium]|nr:septum formation initiator family protein [Actinomycetota bacterium]